MSSAQGSWKNRVSYLRMMRIIERIVSAIGRRIDESSPMVDARLADGSRVNVVIPPLAVDGPHLSIRRFGKIPVSEQDLLATQTLTQPMLEWRDGSGEDDVAERSLGLHFREGANRHHRRFR